MDSFDYARLLIAFRQWAFCHFDDRMHDGANGLYIPRGIRAPGGSTRTVTISVSWYC